MIREPNINSIRAKPFITWHLNWQTRLNKEQMVAMPPHMSEDAMRNPAALLKQSESKGFPLPIAFEACPIGGAHARNNTSSGFARAFGPKSWSASGGLVTQHGVSFGDSRKNGDPQEALHRSLRQVAPMGPPRRSESTPLMHEDVSAECLRAAPNRSVASILRAGEAGMPEHRRRLASSRSSSEAHGGEGYLAEDLAAEAACMRAAPNRSVASILRAGEAGMQEPTRRRAASSAASSSSYGEDLGARANVMRAAPNRSVASILRAGESGMPQHSRRRAASSTAGSSFSEASAPSLSPHRGQGRRRELSAEDQFVAAEVMRAAPNRSVASVLRMGGAAA